MFGSGMHSNFAAEPPALGSVKIRPATFNDYEQIMQLETRHGLRTRSYEDWTHLWKGNPAYREVKGDWTIGWVAEDEHHQIVASLANIPVLYEFNGSRIL